MTLLYRLAGQFGAILSGPALPVGGLGAFTAALGASARHAGAEICTDAAVERVLIRADKVCGVRLAGGAEVAAEKAFPRGSKERSLRWWEPTSGRGLRETVEPPPHPGAAAKLHLALSGLPEFNDLPAVLMVVGS